MSERIMQTKSTLMLREGDRQRPTIFFSLLESNLPASEKSIERLSGEAMAVVGAGTETTSFALIVLTFYLLSNTVVRQTLQQELLTVGSGPSDLPSWTHLEKLPYLSAVILEGLRLMYGIPGRLQQIATDEDLLYQGSWKPSKSTTDVCISHMIPRGYAIGMSAYLVHSNPAIFQDASNFLPERWLNSKGQRITELDSCLFTFSKGSRQCIGMQ